MSIVVTVAVCVEIIVRLVCIVLGFPTFVCAATAVSNLNSNATSLRYVEDSRDRTVSAAGTVIFLGLLTMLLECVILSLRLVTKKSLNAFVDITISIIFALLYFCLGTSMAVYADEWRHQEISYPVIFTIYSSLAAASVFCFLYVCIFFILAGFMLWNRILDPKQDLDGSSDIYSRLKSEIPGETLECYPKEYFVEFSIRIACIVMGFPTFVCAATAVSHLNGDSVILRDVEQSSDSNVTAAGMLVGVALVSMSIEGVITAMRFCTKSCVIAIVDIIFSTVVALVYFCLAIPMAVFSVEWNDMESPSVGNSSGFGDVPVDVSTIATSLAAAAVFGFLSMSLFAVLAVKMCLFLFERNMESDVDALDEKTLTAKDTCDYHDCCTRYFASLGIDVYKDEQYNRCYCKECSWKQGCSEVSTMGKPAAKFAVPIGWMKFGIKVPPHGVGNDIFTKWHVAYHGTSPDKLEGILKCGGLLVPGDSTVNGVTISIVDGHLPPTGEIFVSPSIHYCTCEKYGGDIYAKSKIYYDTVTCQTYKAQVLLQVRIEPGSYKVGPQTVYRDTTYQIDPLFSNNELEWSTDRRGVVIIYGVLVKLQLLP